jgi:hypothetical protein
MEKIRFVVQGNTVQKILDLRCFNLQFFDFCNTLSKETTILILSVHLFLANDLLYIHTETRCATLFHDAEGE